MDSGRMAAAMIPEDFPSLDEDSGSPGPFLPDAISSCSDVSLPARATSNSTVTPPATALEACTSVREGTAFGKLPKEVIELYVFCRPVYFAHFHNDLGEA